MRGEEIAYRGIDASGKSGVHFVSVLGYPSGEPLVTERPQQVEVVLLRPRDMRGFFGGICWIEALISRGSGAPVLLLPFVPGARQDRLNADGDYLFTARSVAKLVNALVLPGVVVLDPHSDVTPALIDRCEVISAADTVRADSFSPQYDVVVSPDAGAEKRAGAVARRLGIPLIHGWKTRDIGSGKISGFGLEPCHANTALVVDDICDGGGTFVGLAEVLMVRGITADLYVTHGLFSQGTAKLLAHYRKVFCTDSISVDRPGVEINQVCQRILERKGI